VRNYAPTVCILFHINYEIESLEVYLVMKIPPFTIEVLGNVFNVLEGILPIPILKFPLVKHTHNTVNRRHQLIKKYMFLYDNPYLIF